MVVQPNPALAIKKIPSLEVAKKAARAKSPIDKHTEPHMHKKSENPNAIYCRRPNGVLWRLDQCLVPHEFKARTMPTFVAENFINYFNSNDDYMKLARRMRRDARLLRDSGDKKCPLIPKDDKTPKAKMLKKMFRYFIHRLNKGKVHAYSPVKYCYDRVALRFGVMGKRLTCRLYPDALAKMAEWRFGEYFIKNYTVDECTYDDLKELFNSNIDMGKKNPFNSHTVLAHFKLLEPATFKTLSATLRDKVSLAR